MIILQWFDKQTVAEMINNQKNELNEVFVIQMVANHNLRNQ